MLSPVMHILHQHLLRVPEDRRSEYQRALLAELSGLASAATVPEEGGRLITSGMQDYRTETIINIDGKPITGGLLCSCDDCPIWPK